MKFKILLVLTVMLMARTSFAQSLNVLDGVYVKEHTAEREPLTYSYLREADVMWSKRIWRVIDLNEKMNLPLKYPIGKILDRKSLIDLMLDAIKEGSLTAYSTTDDEFTLPVTMKEIAAKGGARSDTTKMNRPDPPYEEYDTVIAKEFAPEKVIAYRLKEEWFFDKQRSVMDVRIIGIAPMIYDIDESGNLRPGNVKKPLFWVYYPEARKLFENSEVFNRENDGSRRSFDDIFQKRLFSSFIYKESNVYDRRIEDYRQGLSALLEAERIKNDITNFEHDMWEY
ncbi:MAG: gliding motility protein GldN [Bacteroidetes bacterium]|nr:gliding motility protein GldN [Bacteroidota bacterium]